MKVAIIHDALINFGGAERVVCALHECFPGAPIYTPVYLPEHTHAIFRKAEVHTSFLQYIARSERALKLLFPLTFITMQQLDLSGYDVVLSSSTYCAKNVNAAPGAVHVCYCYAPFRPVWEFDRYTAGMEWNPVSKRLLRLFFERFQTLDLKAAQKPHHIIAISRYAALKIKRSYGRDPSSIIYPPVDVEKYRCDPSEGYFLVVSRLLAYKKVDIVIRGFNELGYPLKVVGDGPDMPRLRAMAGPTVEFTGAVEQDVLTDYYARCRCLVFPGEEDFGLTPVEAHACGKPVIAFAAGGALETIVAATQLDSCEPYVAGTGIFFSESSPAAVVRAVQEFEKLSFNPTEIRQRAQLFDKSRFQRRIVDFIQSVYRKRSHTARA